MADKKKTSDKQAPSLDEIEDAVFLNTTESSPTTDEVGGDHVQRPASPDEDQRLQDSDTVDASIETDEEPASPETDKEADDTATGDTTGPDHSSSSTKDEEPETKRNEPPAQLNETVIVRKGGFFPMLLGGVAAAAIGFGVAYSGALNGLPFPGLVETQDRMTELNDQIAAQDRSLADFIGRLAALEDEPASDGPSFTDPTPRLEELFAQIDALARRMDALEARPSTSDAPNDAQTQAAIEAARAELEQFRQSLADQRNEITALTDAAAEEEQAARDTAFGVMQRAALTRIQTALDSGSPFFEAAAELRESGVDVPQPLIDQANDGVATLSSLQADFPELARDALRAARQEGGATGFGGFLESQLGLRSLEPREGDDPDAVLSRAEAALQAGDLTGALAEIDALPDSAANVLAEWRARAATRLAAVAASQDLSQALNTN